MKTNGCFQRDHKRCGVVEGVTIYISEDLMLQYIKVTIIDNRKSCVQTFYIPRENYRKLGKTLNVYCL